MLKFFQRVDLVLYLFPMLLWVIGCAVLWSLTYASSDTNVASLAVKQFVFGLIGIATMFGLTALDYRGARSVAWLIGLGTILLLIAVELFGTTSLGATRWLAIGIFQLQPSEIAKIALIVLSATSLSVYMESVSSRVFVIMGLLLVPPLILVLVQPDLGTGIILVAISLGVLLALRLKRAHYVFLGAILAFIIAIGTLSYQKVPPFGGLLHDYQRARIQVFLNPDADPLGRGYNVRQAVIAIGNGGMLGRGLGKEVGQLSQLNFLPKAYTDFIFAALAESMGFVGAGLVLLLFAGLLWRILVSASVARDSFGALICYGYLSMMLPSVLINIGMNLGIMPVTGIPLPFLSAGGTALIMNFIGVGLVQSVVARRQVIKFD